MTLPCMSLAAPAFGSSAEPVASLGRTLRPRLAASGTKEKNSPLPLGSPTPFASCSASAESSEPPVPWLPRTKATKLRVTAHGVSASAYTMACGAARRGAARSGAAIRESAG